MKKFAAILLAVLVMMLSCSAMADTVWSTVEVDLPGSGWCSIPADQYVKIAGDDLVSASASDYDFYYDSASATLVMNSVSLNGKLYFGFDVKSQTIELIGSNVIEYLYETNDYAAVVEIAEEVDMTVTGSGSLKIVAKPGQVPKQTGGDGEYNPLADQVYAMECNNLTVSGGQLILEAGNSERYSQGLYAGRVVVNKGATLTVTSGNVEGYSCAMEADEVKVNGGKLFAHSGKAPETVGILAKDEIEVTSGSLYATSADFVSSDDEYGDGITAALLVPNMQSLSLRAGGSARMEGLTLGSGLKLFAGQKLNSPLVDGEMIDYRGADCAAELGADLPAQRALISTSANVPATGDMSNPALWLAMVGAALIVLVSMKKRAFAR